MYPRLMSVMTNLICARLIGGFSLGSHSTRSLYGRRVFAYPPMYVRRQNKMSTSLVAPPAQKESDPRTTDYSFIEDLATRVIHGLAIKVE